MLRVAMLIPAPVRVPASSKTTHHHHPPPKLSLAWLDHARGLATALTGRAGSLVFPRANFASTLNSKGSSVSLVQKSHNTKHDEDMSNAMFYSMQRSPAFLPCLILHPPTAALGGVYRTRAWTHQHQS